MEQNCLSAKREEIAVTYTPESNTTDEVLIVFRTKRLLMPNRDRIKQ